MARKVGCGPEPAIHSGHILEMREMEPGWAFLYVIVVAFVLAAGAVVANDVLVYRKLQRKLRKEAE